AHQINEIGTAAEVLSLGSTPCQANCLCRIASARVLELDHRDSSLTKVACIAATIPLYAPQRHRFPLILSRTSSCVRLIASTHRSSVSALGMPRSTSPTIPIA